MNKGVSPAILGARILLIIFGVSASKSFSSDISRFFTGSPTGQGDMDVDRRRCSGHYRAGWTVAQIKWRLRMLDGVRKCIPPVIQ